MTTGIGGIGSTINQANIGIQRASERISSGRQINAAEDDAAGFALANRLSRQINEFSQSSRNANDGVSFLQTAEGGLSSVTQNLERIRELSLQASNGTLNDSDRQALNEEAQQLRDEVVRTVETTSFNGQTLLNNDESTNIQLGADETNSVDISVDNLGQFLDDIDFENLDISTVEGAQGALDLVDQTQTQVDSSLSDIGAQTNRLESSVNTLFNSEIEASGSRSRIEDADLAREVTDLTTDELRRDVSIAIQSQANQQGRNVLRLLGL